MNSEECKAYMDKIFAATDEPKIVLCGKRFLHLIDPSYHPKYKGNAHQRRKYRRSFGAIKKLGGIAGMLQHATT